MKSNMSYLRAVQQSGAWNKLGATEWRSLIVLLLNTGGVWRGPMDALASLSNTSTHSCYRLLRLLMANGLAQRERTSDGRSAAWYRLVLPPQR